MFRFLLLLLTLCYFSCSKTIIPTMRFAESPLSPQADYSQLDSWASHPRKNDYADKTPPTTTPEAQAQAKADVFFIHPTTYLKATGWNADVKDTELNHATESRAIMHQASVFNGSCSVFAPRYRQIALGGFYDKTPEQKKDKEQALMLAYGDIKTAFEYYLEHENKGRPIVIAGHSQGAFHAQILLKEFFDGTDLQKQLVAAYVLGWAFKAEKYEHLPVSQAPDQIGCIMGWSTWQKKKLPKSYDTVYKGAVSTNPLSWQTNNERVAKTHHKGFLMPNFKTFRTQKVFAEGHDGVLWISRPHPLFLKKNYHIGDINIFWLDIRENVAERVEAYLKAHGEVFQVRE